MYMLLIHLLHPYTIAYVITGVAIVGLWRKREATRGRLILLTLGFGLMLVLSLPARKLPGARFVGVVIPAAQIITRGSGSHCRAFGKL